MAITTSRRRRGEKGESLPSFAGSSDTSAYNNGKKNRRKNKLSQGTLLILGLALVLVLALAIAVIRTGFEATTTPHKGWRKLAHRVTAPFKKGQGCFGADIHKIAGKEPNPPGICINDPDLMPLSWRAPKDIVFKDEWRPWTEQEQAMADEAVDKGLEELITFFENASDRQIKRLGTDATNSVFDYVVSSQEMPEFHERAVDVAVKVLKINVQDYVNNHKYVGCDGMFAKMSFTGYAYRLAQEAPKDLELQDIRDTLIENLNDSIRDCGTLDRMRGDGTVEEPWREALKSTQKAEDVVYDWFMWAVALTNCLTIPELELPSDSEEFIARVWQYFPNYKIPGYEDFEEKDDPRGNFVEMAYLATHLQFIPTGYGRHYAYMKDAPYLYHYYRENYFAAMNEGGHDLIAEFIDMLTTYGCSPENDIQVRHGMRYMLHLYQNAGRSFVNHLEPYEREDTLTDYDRIHKIWTGIATLETKGCFEPEVPGSYGYAFRNALKSISST